MRFLATILFLTVATFCQAEMSLAYVAQMKGVLPELDVDERQSTECLKIFRDVNAFKIMENGKRRPAKEFFAFVAEQDRKLEKLLTEKQFDRLKQIRLQALLFHAQIPELMTKLGHEPNQKKLEELSPKFMQLEAQTKRDAKLIKYSLSIDAFAKIFGEDETKQMAGENFVFPQRQRIGPRGGYGGSY